jgi:hypothetical protein
MSDDVIIRHVVLQQREAAPTIAVDVFQLLADLSDGLALPGHFNWG